MLLGCDYAASGRADDATREASLALTLRPDEPMLFYNAACLYCSLNKIPEALEAIRQTWKKATATRTGRGEIRIYNRCTEIPNSIVCIRRLEPFPAGSFEGIIAV